MLIVVSPLLLIGIGVAVALWARQQKKNEDRRLQIEFIRHFANTQTKLLPNAELAKVLDEGRRQLIQDSIFGRRINWDLITAAKIIEQHS